MSMFGTPILGTAEAQVGFNAFNAAVEACGPRPKKVNPIVAAFTGAPARAKSMGTSIVNFAKELWDSLVYAVQHPVETARKVATYVRTQVVDSAATLRDLAKGIWWMLWHPVQAFKDQNFWYRLFVVLLAVGTAVFATPLFGASILASAAMPGRSYIFTADSGAKKAKTNSATAASKASDISVTQVIGFMNATAAQLEEATQELDDSAVSVTVVDDDGDEGSGIVFPADGFTAQPQKPIARTAISSLPVTMLDMPPAAAQRNSMADKIGGIGASYFERRFAEISAVGSFNPSWLGDDGSLSCMCDDPAVREIAQPGGFVKMADSEGRHLIIAGTILGSVVVYQRFPDGFNTITYCAPAQFHESGLIRDAERLSPGELERILADDGSFAASVQALVDKNRQRLTAAQQ